MSSHSSLSNDPKTLAFCTDKTATQTHKLRLLSDFFKHTPPRSLEMIQDRKSLSIASICQTVVFRCVVAGAYGLSVGYISKFLKHPPVVSAVLGGAVFSIDMYFEWKQLRLKRLQFYDKYEHNIWKSVCAR